MMVLSRFSIFKRVACAQLLYRVDFEFSKPLLALNCFTDTMVRLGNGAFLLLRFLLKIRSARKLDTIICLGHSFGSWNAVQLILKAGTICPFVVIDPADVQVRRNNRGRLGLIFDHLQLIPDAEYLNFDR